MIRINLLPHRAEKRRRRKIQFAALCGVSFVLGVLVVALVYGAMQARIFYQQKRNDYLKSEIAKLDKQIEELKRLRQQVKALLARKEVVEGLQSTRSDVVHLMDQMLRILPQGVYLRSLRQTGDNIAIIGIAQSSARVSTLMRSIDQSPWLNSPHLIEVQATQVGNTRTNLFSMTFKLSKQTAAASSPLGTRTAGAAGPASAPPATQTGAASAPAGTPATPGAASGPAAALGTKR
jgi:type IV pilus assembly protein PilN